MQSQQSDSQTESQGAGDGVKKIKRRAADGARAFAERAGPEGDMDEEERRVTLVMNHDNRSDPPITVFKQVVPNLKPHQIEGLSFLWRTGG